MDVSNEFQGENCCQVSILDAARSRDVDAFFQEISICKVVRISLSDLADLGREELAFYSKFRIQALRRGLEVRVDR